MAPIRERDEIRKARNARGETTAERVRKAVEEETGAPLPESFFHRAAAQTGSGPVEVDIRKAADPGRWLNEVVARHNANLYDWPDSGQPTGTRHQTPGSLRDEGITEHSRADALADVVAAFRAKYGRGPTDDELGALLVLVDGMIRDRRLGDESATVPPGNTAVSSVRKADGQPTPVRKSRRSSREALVRILRGDRS